MSKEILAGSDQRLMVAPTAVTGPHITVDIGEFHWSNEIAVSKVIWPITLEYCAYLRGKYIHSHKGRARLKQGNPYRHV